MQTYKNGFDHGIIGLVGITQSGQPRHWVGQVGHFVLLVVRVVAMGSTKSWRDIQMNYLLLIYIKVDKSWRVLEK